MEAHLDSAPVIISGMAGSSIGWLELPYARVPWRLDGSDSLWRELEPVAGPRGLHRVILLSGVRTATDVMRGEETEALGLFQLDSVAGPSHRGTHTTRPLPERSIVIMPGTHSKHLHVEAAAIVDFETFMTGELFEVLGRHSILRHSIGDAGPPEQYPSTECAAAFKDGVRLASELPLSAALFRVRTRDVLDAAGAHQNRAFCSGLVIGGELAYLRHRAGSEVPIVLCATGPLAEQYAAALDSLGLGGRLNVIPSCDAKRLSALGQALVARHLGLV
jgi:2-dehydro-3-deoxygalactonokinase